MFTWNILGCTIILVHFNINIKEVDKNISLLYWVSKQHKNPYKFRFIAGATNCTTKTLSVQLSLALKLIKDHFLKTTAIKSLNSMVTASTGALVQATCGYTLNKLQQF